MSPKVDPRVAKRRAEVSAAATRKRARRWIVVGSVVALLAAIAGVLKSPVFDVRKVEVTGAQHTPVAAVLAATGLSSRGHPMIAVDRFALAQRIERLPWVAHAEVTRHWPNVVRVRITERVPLGVIAVPNGVAVVDGTGRVLETVAAPPANTFAITIAPDDTVPAAGHTVGPALRGAVRILAALSKGLAAQTESMHRLPGAPPTYELTLHGPVTVRFGEATQIADKLAAAEAVLAAEHAPGTIIDVEVPAAPTVQRGSAPPTPVTTATTAKPAKKPPTTTTTARKTTSTTRKP